MGAKFYRASYKHKNLRRRLINTRTWWRGLKWVCYHAHPTYIPGHPFKGAANLSIGQLANPEMIRFQLATPYFFAPVNPEKTVGSVAQQAASDSFGSFFVQYFAGTSYNLNAPRAATFLRGMRRCFENNQENPVSKCQYYINGFQRTAVAN